MKINFTNAIGETLWVTEFCEDGFTSVFDESEAAILPPDQVATVVTWLQEKDVIQEPEYTVQTIRVMSNELNLLIQN